jgi:hypothetical protein
MLRQYFCVWKVFVNCHTTLFKLVEWWFEKWLPWARCQNRRMAMARYNLMPQCAGGQATAFEQLWLATCMPPLFAGLGPLQS